MSVLYRVVAKGALHLALGNGRSNQAVRIQRAVVLPAQRRSLTVASLYVLSVLAGYVAITAQADNDRPDRQVALMSLRHQRRRIWRGLYVIRVVPRRFLKNSTTTTTCVPAAIKSPSED